MVLEEKARSAGAACPQLQGSPAVEAANDRFSATMTNVVRWGDAAAPAATPRRQLRSDTEIQARADFVRVVSASTGESNVTCSAVLPHLYQ